MALPHLPPGHNAERTIMGNEIYFMGIDIGTYTDFHAHITEYSTDS